MCYKRANEMSLKPNYSHGLVSRFTNLSMFLLTRPKALFQLDHLHFFQKYFCLLLSGSVSFSFFTNAACKFWKGVNSIINGKTIILLNQARFISITKVSVQQASDFHDFNGSFCSALYMESFPWNLFLVVVRSNGNSLSGKSPNTE